MLAESVGALASAASAATSLGPSLALESSVSIGKGMPVPEPPYAGMYSNPDDVHGAGEKGGHAPLLEPALDAPLLEPVLESSVSIGKGPPYSTPPDPAYCDPDPADAPLLEPALAIASGAATLRSLALDSLPPQAVVATTVPIVPAAKSAARDKRPASTRVGPISTLAVAPQNGQTASPRLM
jgi:hypothetical protein